MTNDDGVKPKSTDGRGNECHILGIGYHNNDGTVMSSTSGDVGNCALHGCCGGEFEKIGRAHV